LIAALAGRGCSRDSLNCRDRNRRSSPPPRCARRAVACSSPRHVTIALSCPTARALQLRRGRQPAMEQTMRVKIPTDPTIPNPQDTKDAPHSHKGGGSGFMAYVSPWEQLADAIRRVTAGGRPKELAQTDLCRAIADGAIKIRCKLKRHTTRSNISDARLDGKDFEIPTEIKPEDLDWERSRPLKPWFVRRGSYSIPGHWNLEWIEVCRDDVTKALCLTKERDESTRHASSETPATSTSWPALESQEMRVGSVRRSTAGSRKPGAPGRRRGARPEKFEQTKDAMRNDLQQGELPGSN
jgi:hypothetical protein